MQSLQQIVVAGQFTPERLIWKVGMTVWAKASDVEELKALFAMPLVSPTV